MTLITRYVILELLKVFLTTLAALTLLIVVAGLLHTAIREGLGFGPILRMIPYMLPNALRFAVPGTILFAACSVFGRMAAGNEITALKSLGISPLVVIWPALFLAFLLSLGAVWLNDVAVSWGHEGVKQVILHSVEEITYGMLRTHRSYSTDAYSINVKRVVGRRLIAPTFTFHDSGVTLTADEAELRLNREKGALRVVLQNCEFDWGAGTQGVLPGTREYDIPLTEALRRFGSRAADLPLTRIPAELKTRDQRIIELQQELAAEAAFELATGDFAALSDPFWETRRRELRQLQTSVLRLHTEPWRRWANGFSCFFFVLIGAPLAIRLRNCDLWTTFALCFLPILIVYYPLLAFGLARAKSGDLPPLTVWFANVILCMIGAVLLRRVNLR